MNIISASGAIHCITKCIGVNDPLLIRHHRLTDTYDTQNPYPATAYIRHKSGIASAMLYWTTDTAQAWISLSMADQGGNNWGASIPAQPAGTTVYYYVQGTSVSGKTQVRPIVAPEGWWKFRVLDINSAIADPNGPQITDLFPNPCQNHVVVSLDRVRKEQVRISVSDVLGRNSLDLYNGPIAADGRILLDLSAIAPGTYALTVESPWGRSTRKLVKQ
jgi:hypothetical protein